MDWVTRPGCHRTSPWDAVSSHAWAFLFSLELFGTSHCYVAPQNHRLHSGCLPAHLHPSWAHACSRAPSLAFAIFSHAGVRPQHHPHGPGVPALRPGSCAAPHHRGGRQGHVGHLQSPHGLSFPADFSRPRCKEIGGCVQACAQLCSQEAGQKSLGQPVHPGIKMRHSPSL